VVWDRCSKDKAKINGGEINRTDKPRPGRHVGFHKHYRQAGVNALPPNDHCVPETGD